MEEGENSNIKKVVIISLISIFILAFIILKIVTLIRDNKEIEVINPIEQENKIIVTENLNNDINEIENAENEINEIVVYENEIINLNIEKETKNSEQQEYIQTTLKKIEKPWSKKKVSWEPININMVNIELAIYKPEIPNISILKEQYLEGEKLEKNEKIIKLSEGQTIDYEITIKNEGNVELTEIEFSDFLEVDGSKRQLDEITSVTVDGTKRNYYDVNESSIKLEGPLKINETLEIKASYTIKDDDISEDKENTIKNSAFVKTKQTEEKKDEVSVGVTTKEIEPIIRKANIIQKNYEPKNIVIVLDLSSSMLKIAGSDEYPKDCYDAGKNLPNSAKLNASTKTKLYHAKKATKQFINDILENNPDTSITLISFNYDNYTNAINGISQEEYYLEEVNSALANSNVKNYMKTQTLVSATNNNNKLIEAIDNIYLTYPLLTNVVSALEETQKVINNLEKTEKYKNRDMEVVFVGDGKPSYSNEFCGKNNVGFYSKNETQTKIKQISDSIKNSNFSKTHIYTVEYAVPESEKADAKETFSAIASASSYRYVATMENLAQQLKKVGDAILKTSTKEETSDERGDIKFTLETNTKLKIDSINKLVFEVGDDIYIEISKKEEIEKMTSGIVEYIEDKKQFIIHAGEILEGKSINLSYYYEEN